MSAVTVGSLFSGYGGLDAGVALALDAEPIWFSEFDKAPSAILAHHYPAVPNLGDITKVDWSTVARPTIITGGSPCQDMSHAGKRMGMKAGTRSGLWSNMLDAITALRPQLVVWENVRGAYSACASSDIDSDLGYCPRCVEPSGGRKHDPNVRALGRVLGDLAGIGYDAAWTGLRAADVGAPHGRFRVFVLAWPAADADRLGRKWTGSARGGRTGSADGGLTATGRLSLLPTPRATDGTKGGPNQRGSSGDLMLPSAVMLMNTPTVEDAGRAGSQEWADKWAAGETIPQTQQRLRTQVLAYSGSPDFGQYAAAITRWEAVTRPAPSPTEATGKGGAQRLSPAFVEWMQGLPAGWVTDPAIGISRNDQLKALGNGVVPAHCAAAVRHLLGVRADSLGSAA